MTRNRVSSRWPEFGVGNIHLWFVTADGVILSQRVHSVQDETSPDVQRCIQESPIAAIQL
jgi:hypothetical protein